jgi:hypothetical protein
VYIFNLVLFRVTSGHGMQPSYDFIGIHNANDDNVIQLMGQHISDIETIIGRPIYRRPY